MSREIDKIIIHCSATKEGREFNVDDVRLWHKAKGWRDVGYHYVIPLNGDLEVGREESEIGSHTYRHNLRSIGVCYIGGLDENSKPKDTRTDEQKETLRCLIADLMVKYPKAKVYGHYNFSSKACPSFNVEKDL